MNPEDKSQDSFLRNLTNYRQSLIAAEQAMQAEYDKGVLTLSGGALGISLMFLKDIVGTKSLLHGEFLLLAWICWGLSISFILASYFTNAKAIRRAVEDTDIKTIYLTLAKSGWSTVTKILNGLGGVGFSLGVVSLVIFVANNLPNNPSK